MEKILNFINGEFSEPIHKKYLENTNPSTGKTYSLVARSTKEDVEVAVRAAAQAFEGWKQTAESERAQVLRKIGDLILENVDELAKAETIDSGKTIKRSLEIEIPRAAKNFHFFADFVCGFHGDSYESTQTSHSFTLNQPLGVVGCISPWNLPLYLLTWKIAPALAVGNTVIAKPSELTPKTAELLAKIFQQAKLPAGVCNIIHGLGSEAGESLVSHPHVKAISFTGSTRVGQHIAQQCAKDLKKSSLELGGKNANIIFADANIEKAVTTTIASSFQNQGQICLCGSRVLIEEKIYNTVRDQIVRETKKLILGNPLQQSTQQGALISREHLQKVESMVNAAALSGAKILTGGKRATVADCPEGFFYEPTVIENAAIDSEINQQEVFGPVITLIPFKDEQDAIRIANCTRYGLAGSIWTENISRAQRVARQVQAGLLWINTWMNRDLRTPFGGVKMSGLGREGGKDVLRFFSESKTICIEYGDNNV